MEIVSKTSRAEYIVIYDISDDARRRKLSRFLEEYGIRIQRSAFRISCAKSKIDEITKAVQRYINNSEDDLRIFKVEKSLIANPIYEQILDFDALII